jgi:hypothetical protein
VSADIEFIKLDVAGRIQHIEENLLKQDPLLPVHLSAIHGALIQYEELVHLLTDAQISSLVAGQVKHTGVSLMKEITSKSRASVASKIPKTSQRCRSSFYA